jgi:hypothetical protein
MIPEMSEENRNVVGLGQYAAGGRSAVQTVLAKLLEKSSSGLLSQPSKPILTPLSSCSIARNSLTFSI